MAGPMTNADSENNGGEYRDRDYGRTPTVELAVEAAQQRDGEDRAEREEQRFPPARCKCGSGD